MEMMRVETLVPYARNAKTHPQSQIDQIILSIEEFGFNDPIGVDSVTKTIIEGHGRYEAAKQMGLETVPVIQLGHMTEAQRRAYAIAHNALTMNTGFDDAILRPEILDILSCKIDPELLMIDQEKLNKFLYDAKDACGTSVADLVDIGFAKNETEKGKASITFYLKDKAQIVEMLKEIKKGFEGVNVFL